MLCAEGIKRTGVFSPGHVAGLLSKFKSGRAIGVKDNMAFIGILSTQLLLHRFKECSKAAVLPPAMPSVIRA